MFPFYSLIKQQTNSIQFSAVQVESINLIWTWMQFIKLKVATVSAAADWTIQAHLWDTKPKQWGKINA